MHERNIAFDVIVMQEHGAMSDRWRRRQVLHDVTSLVVCHSLFATTRNSGLKSGALETAEQSKGMQIYHEFCLKKVVKSALKLLILGWVVVYDKYKLHLCLILITWSHLLIYPGLKALDLQSQAFKAGENQLVRSGDSDQTLIVHMSEFKVRHHSNSISILAWDGATHCQIANG
jgi:hypothetical protein